MPIMLEVHVVCTRCPVHIACRWRVHLVHFRPRFAFLLWFALNLMFLCPWLNLLLIFLDFNFLLGNTLWIGNFFKPSFAWHELNSFYGILGDGIEPPKRTTQKATTTSTTTTALSTATTTIAPDNTPFPTTSSGLRKTFDFLSVSGKCRLLSFVVIITVVVVVVVVFRRLCHGWYLGLLLLLLLLRLLLYWRWFSSAKWRLRKDNGIFLTSFVYCR